MSKVLHNPKSHAPAIYIPCWLIQVPIDLLSHAAKITYGRLSQWANEKGIVYRSVACLAQEIGVSCRSIESYLKELRKAKLIGTYQKKSGGVNHFEFYDHEWMHAEINDKLVYKSDSGHPPQDLVVPPAGSCGTPPQDPAALNIKEIKINKTKEKIEKKKSLKVFSIDDALKENPHNLTRECLEEWIEIRLSRHKAPLTHRAWARTNKVLTELQSSGIGVTDAVDRMLASGWRGIELSYFESEIRALSKTKSISNTTTSYLIGKDLRSEFGF